MERTTARSIAAILAVTVTLCGLKGIAELATFEGSKTDLPVIVLEKVEIVAKRQETTESLIAESSPEQAVR